MLKFSGLIKRTPFIFTELDGVEHELEITEFTIADTKKLVELQKPIIENKDMPMMDQSDLLIASRIICAVKVRATGEYYWNSIEDLTGQPYPNELGNELYTEIDKLNPVSVGTLDEKKSES